MRSLFFYLILGLCSIQAAGQGAAPQFKDNTIYITSKASGDALFSEVGGRLAKAGFPLTTTNKEFGQIATGEKIIEDYRHSDYHYSYYVVVLFEGNKAIVKPTITRDLILGNYRWYYMTRKASTNHQLMEHLLSVLKGIGDVSFGKEQD
jgi:hypothetical protein